MLSPNDHSKVEMRFSPISSLWSPKLNLALAMPKRKLLNKKKKEKGKATMAFTQ